MVVKVQAPFSTDARLAFDDNYRIVLCIYIVCGFVGHADLPGVVDSQAIGVGHVGDDGGSRVSHSQQARSVGG